MDWALFHVEQDYLQVWHSYHRALRNRNSLLRRSAKEEEYYVWESIMANTAKDLKESWQKDLGCLQQYYQDTADQHPCAEVKFMARKDKYKTDNFLEYLQSTRPHKADLEFKIKGRHISTIFSRGQIKLFIILLSIAQARLLKIEREITPIFLADDLAAELDKKTVEMLLEFLYGEKMQMFITATNPGEIIRKNTEITLFHVEHGHVKNVRMIAKSETQKQPGIKKAI